MKTLSRIVALALVIAPCAAQAAAQGYPARPVRTVIAFPPGSATDIIGRVILAKVTDLWGQQVIADNRGGAGGSLGTAIAAQAPGDGYTLLINSGAFTVAPYMYTKLPYSIQKDFVDISALVAMPNVLVVPPSSKIKSLREFIAEAKASPGKINFAFAGMGSGTHLNCEKFKYAAKIDFTLVAYKGSGEVFPDLLAGRVDTYFAPLSAGLPYMQSGKLRALAVTSLKRAKQLPDVPTMSEAGVPKFEFLLWFGLWGPSGIPAPTLDKIRTGFKQALADPGVQEKLLTLGNEVMDMSPSEFSKFVRQETSDAARLLKAAGIKPQ
jgi:tripartite-type tricarboxylate transporter receptor subunit TctC